MSGLKVLVAMQCTVDVYSGVADRLMSARLSLEVSTAQHSCGSEAAGTLLRPPVTRGERETEFCRAGGTTTSRSTVCREEGRAEGRWRGGMEVAVLLLLLAIAVNCSRHRHSLAQSSACYYQPYSKVVSCQCSQQSPAYLALRPAYWVRQLGQEVSC